MDRSELTFAQAEGAEALPSQLKTKQVSQELRAKLWRVLYLYVEEKSFHVDYGPREIGEPWRKIFLSWHVDKLHNLYDEYNFEFGANVDRYKKIVLLGDYVQILELFQFIIRHRDCPRTFRKHVDQALEESRAAYRVFDMTIMPIAEPEAVEAIRSDLSSVSSSSFMSASAHFQVAMTELSSGNFAAAVRESIHGVESACRQLEPEASTLGPALSRLEKRGQIHPAMKEAFGRLYGYTSDAEGIRHALVLQDAAQVDEADALFMFSACAAFVGFLARKSV